MQGCTPALRFLFGLASRNIVLHAPFAVRLHDLPLRAVPIGLIPEREPLLFELLESLTPTRFSLHTLRVQRGAVTRPLLRVTGLQFGQPEFAPKARRVPHVPRTWALDSLLAFSGRAT